MIMNDDDEDDLSHSSSPPLHISTFVFNPPSPGGSNIKEDWRRQIKVNWLPLSLKLVLFFLPPLPVFPKPVKYMISQSRHFHTSRILPSVGIEKEDWALEIVLIQSNIFRASFVRMPVAGFDIITWGSCVEIRIYSVYRQGCLWEHGSFHLIVAFYRISLS